MPEVRIGKVVRRNGDVVVIAAEMVRRVAQGDRKWQNGAFTTALVEGCKADFSAWVGHALIC